MAEGASIEASTAGEAKLLHAVEAGRHRAGHPLTLNEAGIGKTELSELDLESCTAEQAAIGEVNQERRQERSRGISLPTVGDQMQKLSCRWVTGVHES